MRSLDQIYWQSYCTKDCGCKDLLDALKRHPELAAQRDPTVDQQRQIDKLEAAPGKRARRRKAYQASADRRFKDAANLWDVK